MEVCSWDWGAIGSFIGAGATLIGAVIASSVAWCISKEWRNQKGTEVIANEAKEYIYNLSKLESIQTEIETTGISAIRKNELLEEYILYKNKASNHANFLGKACPEDLTLSYLSTNYSAQCLRYIWILKDSKNYKIEDIPHQGDASLLIEHLLIYALYKDGE